MGYSTSFVGQFDCYFAGNKMIGAFLSAIRDGDRVALAMLADWLSENGDPRGERVLSFAAKSTLDLSDFWPLFGLKSEHAAYLTRFSGTRRMRRDPKILDQFPDPVRLAVGLPLGKEGGYFAGGGGYAGQDHDPSILDYNKPPKNQPGLWCQWIPNPLGTAIVWNGGEKFYYYIEWLKYLIEHFLTPWGYAVNGQVDWVGDDDLDRGTILVKDNNVQVQEE